MFKILIQRELSSTLGNVLGMSILVGFLVPAAICGVYDIRISFAFSGYIWFMLALAGQNMEQTEFLLTRAIMRRDIFHKIFFGQMIFFLLPFIVLSVFTFFAAPYLRILFRITEQSFSSNSYPLWLLPVGISLSVLTFCLSIQIAALYSFNPRKKMFVRTLLFLSGFALINLPVVALYLKKSAAWLAFEITLYTIGALALSAVLFFFSRHTFEKKGIY